GWVGSAGCPWSRFSSAWSFTHSALRLMQQSGVFIPYALFFRNFARSTTSIAAPSLHTQPRHSTACRMFEADVGNTNLRGDCHDENCSQPYGDGRLCDGADRTVAGTGFDLSRDRQ